MMNTFSQFANKNFRGIVIAGLMVFVGIAFVNYTFYQPGVQKNSSAYQPPTSGIGVTFEPESINQATGTFTVHVKAKVDTIPALAMYIQGYSMFLHFDKTKLAFKGMTYTAPGRVSAGLGDDGSPSDQLLVNNRGIIYMFGEYPSAIGQLFDGNSQDLGTITFQLLNNQANQIDLDPQYVNKFYKIDATNHILPIDYDFTPLLINQPVTPTSANATPTAGAGTGTPAPTCTPRPACLDAKPACNIAEPAGGWCPAVSPTCDPRVANPIGCTVTPTCKPAPTCSPLVNSLCPQYPQPEWCPAGANTTLNLKLKFQGINQAPNSSESSMIVRVGVSNPEQANAIYQSATFTADAKGIWSGTVSFNLPGTQTQAALSQYKLLVKGPKHIQKRICDAAPAESQPGAYHCENGRIRLNQGDNNLNLSGVYLSTGDLPTQDGVVDSLDIAKVRQNIGKTDAEALRVADVNLDGVVDAQDYALIIAALSIRTDDGETSPVTSGATN